MEPITSVVALVRPSPLTSSGLAPEEGAVRTSAGVAIYVLYVLLQNAHKCLNCFCRGLKKVRDHGHGISPRLPDLSTVLAGNPANGYHRFARGFPRATHAVQSHHLVTITLGC